MDVSHLPRAENLKGMNLYELLDVDPSITEKELKAQKNQINLKYHPDKAAKLSMTPEQIQKEFLRVQEAYSPDGVDMIPLEAREDTGKKRAGP
mmetsp:Transcript_29131/g.39579  ORF Transcript_29131/g.39579 Transcript_29131/m.39579 type:complete len:93 (-) Transcript_29131:54-332(-)